MPLIVIIFLQLWVTLSYSPLVRGEVTSEFMLFPRVETIYHSGLADDSKSNDRDFRAGVDFFLTANYKRLRFLGEYLLDKDEQELERLQLGLLFDENTVWFGRFHNPIGYWGTHFHHGRFLETSASRPGIQNFEDRDGILPTHVSGMLIEGTHVLDNRGLGYTIALGAGPNITSEGLEPWNILSPSSGNQDISATINLHFEPNLYAPTKVGFFVNYTEMPAKGLVITNIQQINTGLYGNWESFPWRILGSSFYIHNRMNQSSNSIDESFFHAYLQTEYILNSHWTFYGRVEETLKNKNDVYLALFPGFVEDKFLGGIRFDFAKNNALKIEVSENQSNGDNFAQFIVQWSALF